MLFRTSSISHPPALLEDWLKGNYQFLASSGASSYLKQLLVEKARCRPGSRRFFGEAFAATQVEHHSGYYSSFKWLTNPRYLDSRPFPQGPTKSFKEQFRDALQGHFGPRQLRNLAERSRQIEDREGVRPVPPDLWLIELNGTHRFIEVKLPGDKLRRSQQLGLAVIESLRSYKIKVSAEVLEVHPT